MNDRYVKYLTLPLNEYALVFEDDSLLEALQALEKSQVNLPPGRQPHRAVLVKDKNGTIVGKLGHLGFLKALEPKYTILGDVERLSKSGLSTEFIESMMENYNFWRDDLTKITECAKHIKLKQVMKPVEESIDENSTLAEAVHQMVMWQTLSILVKREDQVVGILRLSDLFTEISDFIKTSV
ncbi:MAG: CBS domain-containing protein [Candidatus Electryonea clarkiae]|nr:CBS domain-containing protein [Candidatus Electryonea clarkiae]MDP8287044.1 CBS domain-containing protein [Candidatus Electryonea clarkiae]